MTSLCCAPECKEAATTRCPICVKLGQFEHSHYCSQKCFKDSWKGHKKVHKEAEARLRAMMENQLDKKAGKERECVLELSPILASFKVTPNKGENTVSCFIVCDGDSSVQRGWCCRGVGIDG